MDGKPHAASDKSDEIEGSTRSSMSNESNVTALPPILVEEDARLHEILFTYLCTEKRRAFPPSAVVAFSAEQRAQLAQPPGRRDWMAARTLYLAMFGVSEADMARVEGGLLSGGWVGSGCLYGATTLPMTLASAVPSLYLATTSPAVLQRNLVQFARTVLIMQICIALATPFVNSAMQIVSVARQQLMRAPGQPSRGERMKAASYDETAQKLRALDNEMRALEERLRVRQALATVSSPGAGVVDSEQEATEKDRERLLVERLVALQQQFQGRKHIINLNYTGQFYQSFVRALRAVLTLVGQAIGLMAGYTQAGSLTQVAATCLCAALQLFWAAPRDQFNKMNHTLLRNIATVDLEAATTLYIKAGKWNDGSPVLDDLRAQWKRPIGTCMENFTEWLETELAVARQRMASLPARDLWDKAALAAAAERVCMLEADASCLQRDDWLAMSPATKAVLLQAVSGTRPWRLALRTAGARLRQPAELISQIAQRFGSQFAMVVAGSNMQLIVSSLARFINAQRTQAGRPRAISPAAMFTVNGFLCLLTVVMAFSMGAAVNMKIDQRSQLKKKIHRVGFQPRETPRALKAIVVSMFAVPSALLRRARVQNTLRRAVGRARRLNLRVDG